MIRWQFKFMESYSNNQRKVVDRNSIQQRILETGRL